MRNLNTLNQFRDTSETVKKYFGSVGNENNGLFFVPSCIDKGPLRVIASAGEGWDHLSVSRKNRCPNWPEMDQVKRLFFLPGEVAIQFHVADDDHINFHPYSLHIWRSWSQVYELPPAEFVGPKNMTLEDVQRLFKVPSGIFRENARKRLVRDTKK